MSDVKLGQLIDGEAERDCIHVAVAPVVAAHGLAPGAHVGFMADGTVGMAHMSSGPIGIVDPFLKNSVPEGGKFWLVLYQNTVTGMRHQWAHPSFGNFGAHCSVKDDTLAIKAAVNAADSEHWLREFAPSVRLGYDALMAAAKAWVDHGDFYGPGFDFDGLDIPPVFWSHYERVTGQIVVEYKRQSFFSCCLP